MDHVPSPSVPSVPSPRGSGNLDEVDSGPTTLPPPQTGQGIFLFVIGGSTKRCRDVSFPGGSCPKIKFSVLKVGQGYSMSTLFLFSFLYIGRTKRKKL
jgi:hypothetical protein